MTKLITTSYSVWLLILGPITFVFAIGPWLDRYFPVVDPFIVATTRCDEAECVKIDGWLEKRRDCKFVEIYGRIVSPGQPMPRIVEVEFMDRPQKQSVSRPTGQQLWGPWLVRATPGDIVELRSTHRCHPFWDTKAVIATFTVKSEL